MGQQEQLGGACKIVEIDESKFRKSKYGKGREINGKWVFGVLRKGLRGLCPGVVFSPLPDFHQNPVDAV